MGHTQSLKHERIDRITAVEAGAQLLAKRLLPNHRHEKSS